MIDIDTLPKWTKTLTFNIPLQKPGCKTFLILYCTHFYVAKIQFHTLKESNILDFLKSKIIYLQLLNNAGNN